VVVGGGIAGLTAAYELGRDGWSVTVLEASDRVGGKLDAADVDGVALDSGVESLLARRPEAVGLIAELGLDAEVVHPTPAQPRLWLDGSVVPLPRTQLGVPVDVDLLAEVLSPAALARAAAEPTRPAPPLTADVAIGRYVADRFGAEVTDRLLEPLLGGVYAGRSRELSFAAVHPALWARARTGGSLLGHAQALAAAVPATSGPVFAGLRGGVHRLVAALVAALAPLDVVVRTGSTVRTLRRATHGTFLVDGVAFDAVVVAAPAGPAARLLADLVPATAALAEIPYASTAVVTLVLADADLTGSGLLVPPGQLPTVKALTYSSTKWPWVAEAAATRWGSGTAVVRASLGRHGEAATLQVDDATLVRRTLDELRVLPGWATARLQTADVRRWGGALPQYLVGHVERIATVERAVAEVPGLALAGAALHGVGVPACVGSGRAAAASLRGGE
jgi:oxygen-dependent protoporphyrinogen oxidase